MWAHTWSLAVEEHFYFGLAILFWLVMIKRGSKDFRWIPGVFIGIAVACLALRLASWQIFPKFSDIRHVYGTHIRIDSLFYGVLLSYFYHFKVERLLFFTWPTCFLFAIGFLFLAPAFFFPLERYWFVSAIGFILFYLGSGFLVIGALRFTTVNNIFARLCETLGTASYSIYLWHLPVEGWGWWYVINRMTGIKNWYVYAVWYFVGSCAIGYWASHFIEAPILHLRNRLYPSKSEQRRSEQVTPARQ